ncbi:MAG: SEC-C domain-containing protein [Pseudonocardiales bacterium]|nr:SEC-C domain-containing protein [Pseudonocardiales bacterium]MBW0008857.1 SEC-C domain-containing protein [Pseudonocardiales bacterium]
MPSIHTIKVSPRSMKPPLLTSDERAMAVTPTRYRHGLRRDLDLPHDALDHPADRLVAALRDVLGDDALDVDEFATYADRGDDPVDPQLFQGYARHLAEHAREIAWPPGRNDACWGGSSLKYKKCCLPRSRT